MQKSAQQDCQNSSEEAGASQIDLQTPFSPRMVYCGRRGNDAHSAFSASGMNTDLGSLIGNFVDIPQRRKLAICLPL